MNFKSNNEQDTMILSQNIESEKFQNMVICLNGELGSGKTVFVKGFARAMGITDDITSPTFNIIKEYPNGELPLYHMDVYRLEDNNQDIGIKEYFTKGGVTIIEWPEIISDLLPKERLDLYFKFVDENIRLIEIKAYGKAYEDIVNTII